MKRVKRIIKRREENHEEKQKRGEKRIMKTRIK